MVWELFPLYRARSTYPAIKMPYWIDPCSKCKLLSHSGSEEEGGQGRWIDGWIVCLKFRCASWLSRLTNELGGYQEPQEEHVMCNHSARKRGKISFLITR